MDGKSEKVSVNGRRNYGNGSRITFKRRRGAIPAVHFLYHPARKAGILPAAGQQPRTQGFAHDPHGLHGRFLPPAS